MSAQVRADRQGCIGGSDAKVIMSGDQRAIDNLWRQKRGEVEADDLSENILVQLGNVTEPLNLDFFEMRTGFIVTDEQARPSYPEWPIAMSTLDGLVRVKEDGPALGIVECKFKLPFQGREPFSLEKAIQQHFAQVQHNMMTTGLDKAWLSIICGNGQYCYTETPIESDPLFQYELLEAEKSFWECVETGRAPSAPEVDAPKITIDQLKIIEMTGSNQWASLAVDWIECRPQAKKFDKAVNDLKALMPKDAREAFGHGIKITRAKNNALTIAALT